MAELAGLAVPVVHDIGSGLLRAHALMPDEPDAASSLRAGAAVVTCSGDKLLGGPQAGLVLGRRDVVERLRRHPLARALRPGKTTLAALEATLRGPRPPALVALEAAPTALHARCVAIVATLAAQGISADVVPSTGRVGGGSAPGLPLEGWAVALPEGCAALLRAHEPAVLARVEAGRTLVDPRALTEADDAVVAAAVVSVSGARDTGIPGPQGPDVAVVATAGHVDHGKSALVRALTGTDPDRLPEERRRGMTIELGHVWADVDGRRVAVVDVPGHDRLVGTTLAGLGPVAGVLLVVAADEGWSAQTEEHVAAVCALGLGTVALVVTKTDLADPAPVAADALARLEAHGIVPVAVASASARTGAGLEGARAALAVLADHAPPVTRTPPCGSGSTARSR